ncbi:hypothetical protein SISSUDRAFT_1054032 [Sistotremastrum suecicum HHB10207 ss-3]|uniref:Uncharacterized protein n=1 Tax=Sistotremastrum suecicum HHB10207 ss-3 TaxID=1314776 RepID=A0A165YU88_9AGAM|nr:hypothetical protein SISSUDRAFT_1054032 [Sistotremastrum suecicum HHB10207 ss-3]
MSSMQDGLDRQDHEPDRIPRLQYSPTQLMTWREETTHTTTSTVSTAIQHPYAADVEMSTYKWGSHRSPTTPLPLVPTYVVPAQANRDVFAHSSQSVTTEQRRQHSSLADTPWRYGTIFSARDCSMCRYRPACFHFPLHQMEIQERSRTQDRSGDRNLFDLYLTSLKQPFWKGFDWIIPKAGFENLLIRVSQERDVNYNESQHAVCMAIRYNCEAFANFSYYGAQSYELLSVKCILQECLDGLRKAWAEMKRRGLEIGDIESDLAFVGAIIFLGVQNFHRPVEDQAEYVPVLAIANDLLNRYDKIRLEMVKEGSQLPTSLRIHMPYLMEAVLILQATLGVHYDICFDYVYRDGVRWALNKLQAALLDLQTGSSLITGGEIMFLARRAAARLYLSTIVWKGRLRDATEAERELSELVRQLDTLLFAAKLNRDDVIFQFGAR